MKHKRLIATAIAGLAAAGGIIAASNHYNGILPDPSKTPGAINQDINQGNISQNICNPSWSTKSIRPPTSYTSPLKAKQLSNGYALNGDTNSADYELDHLISLELGGSPTDPNNLWPESYKTAPNARDKDKVENFLHSQVCAGTITLAQAQQEISTNWVSVLNEMNSKPLYGATPVGDPDDEDLAL